MAFTFQGQPFATSGAGGAAGKQINDPLGLGIDLYYYPDWAATYVANVTQIGYNEIDARESLDYQKQRDDKDRQYNYWSAEKTAQTALETQKIASAAMLQAAASGDAAAMYGADQDLKAAQEMAAASRYTADKAFEATQLTEANKIKIAAANLNLESKRIAAEEMGAPSAWRTQAGYLRSQGMTQADITPGAIQQAGQALGPVAPELAPTTTPSPMAAPQLPQAAQQAVVGEAGPELATATAQGTQVQPIQRESAWWLRKQGVPQMQQGGFISQQVSREEAEKLRGFPGGRIATVTFPTSAPPIAGGGQVQAGGFFPNPTGAVRSELLDPSQMLQTMLAGSRTPEEYLTREQRGLQFLAGTLPQTGIGGTAPTRGLPVRTAATGTAPTGAAAAGGTTPIVGEGTTEGEPPYLEMLRTGANVPLWQAWGGPRTKPEVGMDIPIKMPHEINYGDFVRLTPTEQQMAFADWQAIGMAPDTALRIMQASAMRGTAQAATAYG